MDSIKLKKNSKSPGSIGPLQEVSAAASAYGKGARNTNHIGIDRIASKLNKRSRERPPTIAKRKQPPSVHGWSLLHLQTETELPNTEEGSLSIYIIRVHTTRAAHYRQSAQEVSNNFVIPTCTFCVRNNMKSSKTPES